MNGMLSFIAESYVQKLQHFFFLSYFLKKNNFIYVFIFGSAGSLLICLGIL